MNKLMLLAAVPALVLGLAACDDSATDTATTDTMATEAAPAPVAPPVVPVTSPTETGAPVDDKTMMPAEGTNPASPAEVPAAEPTTPPAE